MNGKEQFDCNTALVSDNNILTEVMNWKVRREVDHNIVLPPQWAFGVLYGGYTDQQETVDKVNRLIEEDYPVDAYWIDSCFWDRDMVGPKGFINFEGDRLAYPDYEVMWKELASKAVRSGIWIWDRILRDGNEEVFEDFASKGFFKSGLQGIREGGRSGGPRSQTGFIDFNNPKAVAYWKQKLKHFFDKGLDFLKLDVNCELAFVKAGFEASQELGLHTRGRGFTMAHAGNLQDPAFNRYPVRWTGDAKVAWNQPELPDTENWAMGGLKENIEMVANPGNPKYKIGFLTNDTGGFRNGIPNDELFMRWTQFSAFNSIMEVFGSIRFEASNAPYTFSKAAQNNFRFYTHLRMQLFPYIYSYAHMTRLTGNKMVRGNGENLHQYLFGNELLVAPVFLEGERSRYIHLPAGRWIDYWTGEVYDIRNFGNSVPYKAPLERIPVLVRAGAIIPMRRYARAVELGSNRELILDTYPYGTSSFVLYEDDGTSNDYLTGGYAATNLSCIQHAGGILFHISAKEGEFGGIPEERIFILKMHQARSVEKVQKNGKTLDPVASRDRLEFCPEGWYLEEKEEILWVRVLQPAGKSVKLEIIL